MTGFTRHQSDLELRARALLKWATNHRGERPAIVRQQFFDLAAHVTPSVAVEADGIWYFVPTADKAIGRITFSTGNFEVSKLTQAAGLVEQARGWSLRGRHMIDIGANIGTTTIPAVKVLDASHVWACEPAPGNLRLLRANVAANDLDDRVTVVPVALSDVGGTIRFELSADNWGDHRVAGGAGDGVFREDERPHIDVEAVRFDDLLAAQQIDLDRVGLVWIDAQGHDGRILADATSLVQSSVPVVVEYWPYGLRRSSSLALLHEAIETHYSTVVEIGGAVPVEHPAGDVRSLEARYPGIEHTDLLLL
jgi:FkbM family methyltransferase